MAAAATDLSRGSEVGVHALAGAILAAHDLDATRAFYDRVLEGTPHGWSHDSIRRTLILDLGPRRIEFRSHRRPRTLKETAHHVGLRVDHDRLDRTIASLTSASCTIDWWHEDHPAERELSAYVTDPSGNRIQLIPSSPADGALDHITVEIEDPDGTLERVQDLFVRVLGGVTNYWHGVTIEHVQDAKRWTAGDDPCAPWTRRLRGSYPGHVDENYRPDHTKRARPALQFFATFGDVRLGVVLADDVGRQEPPPSVVRGDPAVLFDSRCTSSEVRALLRGLPHEVEGSQVFLRGPDATFIRLNCAGP
jgi:hypothetical protein